MRASPLVRGRQPVMPFAGAGSGARGFGLINRALGAPRTPPFGHYDPEAGSQLDDRRGILAGPQSRPEAWGARPRENLHGEAPQGAPARVMGRPSLSDEGKGPTVRRPWVRRSAPALCGASPSSSFSRRTGRTAAGSRSFPGALTL